MFLRYNCGDSWFESNLRTKTQNTKHMSKNKSNGLGDKVENVIKKVAPSFAEKKKDCIGCKKRKKWLNNFNATFS